MMSPTDETASADAEVKLLVDRLNDELEKKTGERIPPERIEALKRFTKLWVELEEACGAEPANNWLVGRMFPLIPAEHVAFLLEVMQEEIDRTKEDK